MNCHNCVGAELTVSFPIREGDITNIYVHRDGKTMYIIIFSIIYNMLFCTKADNRCLRRIQNKKIVHRADASSVVKQAF